jgi:hypothetical protein
LKAETENEKETHIHWSRSLRARGLKRAFYFPQAPCKMSRSLRARGLKQKITQNKKKDDPYRSR